MLYDCSKISFRLFTPNYHRRRELLLLVLMLLEYIFFIDSFVYLTVPVHLCVNVLVQAGRFLREGGTRCNAVTFLAEVVSHVQLSLGQTAIALSDHEASVPFVISP